MSDHIRPVDRELAEVDQSRLDESTETWVGFRHRDDLDAHNARTVLVENGELTEFAVDLLGVEQSWWKGGQGRREGQIREQLDISPTRYYQLLNTLLDCPEAEAHDPLTIRRLRRLREKRREARTPLPESELP